MTQAERDALKAEAEYLVQNDDRTRWFEAFGNFHDLANPIAILSLLAENERLTITLRIIAGELPPYDNLAGHSDVARAALEDSK